MIERHLQEHGDYLRQMGLLVWGTATMSMSGDDIAQAFALMGIKPVWAEGSHHVIDLLDSEELNRVIRSRLLNPKWIEGMREHRYKGAFEMAASVDYLFAYDATTNLIADYQYEVVSDALVFDEESRAFLEEHNPAALEEMAERLLEAAQRGLWGLGIIRGGCRIYYFKWMKESKNQTWSQKMTSSNKNLKTINNKSLAISHSKSSNCRKGSPEQGEQQHL